MACTRLLIAFLAALSAGIADASDWQFFGFGQQGKDETFLSFDAESISHPTKETTRVRTKAIAVSELERYLMSHNKSVVDHTDRKRLTGYVPPVLLLPTVRGAYADAKGLRRKILITSYELIANTPDIRVVSKFYIEIDCASQRIKMLDGSLFDDGGNSLSGQSNGEYQFITPDSNGEWLSLLVCPTK